MIDVCGVPRSGALLGSALRPALDAAGIGQLSIRGMAGGGRRKVPKSQARKSKMKGGKFVGRFKVGGSGQVMRTRSGRQHGNHMMSARQRRNKRGGRVLPKAYANKYKKAGMLRRNKVSSGGSSGGRRP